MPKTSNGNFVSEVKKVGAQVNIPTKWCEIFAKSLLKIAAKLGVVVEVIPHDECLWIIIISIEENFAEPSFSDPSRANLDIVGFDYHPDWEFFELITVVGFRNYWYNVHLYPKLLKNPKFIAAIENNYSPCRFDRQIRFNKIRETFYQTVKSYDSLGDYLNDVSASGIWHNSLTPNQCIAKLNKLGVTDGETITRLRNTNRKDYNWLEYLHIFTAPKINSALFLKEDPATIAEFERQLEQHLRGMILIDEIYQMP